MASGASEPVYDYSLYGLHLRSAIQLTLPVAPSADFVDIELLPEAPDQLAEATSRVALAHDDWIHHRELDGGWTYVRYDGMFDFLVAPAGHRIVYRLLGPLSTEAFQTYALGRVMSFALVKMGYEPLHAATVVVDGRAVAFLGASTFGKSSLAACFVSAGHRLLTDDVLRLEECAMGLVAFPGPARLKLFPKVARMFLGESATGLSMSPRATKRVFPLCAAQTCAVPVPLAAIYAVTAPRDVHRRQRIRIEPCGPLDAMLNVLSFTHNHHLAGRSRLERQFESARLVVDRVAIRKLSYPRSLSLLQDVRRDVLADLQRSAE